MKLVKRKEGKPDQARRRFLRLLGQAALAAGVGAAGVGLRQAGAAVARRPALKAGVSPIPGYNWYAHRWAFGVDANKCIGCLRCAEACKIENNVPLTDHHFRTWVERYVYLEGESVPRVDSQSDEANIAAAGGIPGRYRFDNRYRNKPVYKSFFVPKLCNHCERPSCVQVCPTGATYKTPDGAVLVDKDYCIGCRYCIQACPYGARFLNPETRTADKCTWCYHRITKGLKPACVEACPVGARIFGDLDDAKSEINAFLDNNRVQVLKPWTGNRPVCYYVGIDSEVT